jgi:hypothetical protein
MHPPPPPQVYRALCDRRAPAAGGRRRVGEGVLGAIGDTPLIRIASLSDATGCEVRHCPQLAARLLRACRGRGRGRRRSIEPPARATAPQKPGTTRLARALGCAMPPRSSHTPKHPPFPPQILGKCEFLNPGGSVKDRVSAGGGRGEEGR